MRWLRLRQPSRSATAGSGFRHARDDKEQIREPIQIAQCLAIQQKVESGTFCSLIAAC